MTYNHKIAAATVSLLCLAGFAPSANAQEWYKNSQAAEQIQTQSKTDDDWDFTLGAGAGYAPEYEGSDEYDVVALPVISADYKDGLFFANMREGVGSYPLQGEDYKVGASIGYAMGRDESDDRKNLAGMGDVDGSVTGNVLAQYTLGIAQISGKVSTALTGDYGTTADIGAGTRYPVTEDLSLTGKVGTTWADEEHMSNHFGINAVQSARSGYSQHDADAGFKSVGIAVGATYLITENWKTNLTVKGDQLIGDAADSPIVKDDFVPSVFVSTSYDF